MNKRLRSLYAALSKTTTLVASTGCGYMFHTGVPVKVIVCCVAISILVVFYSEYKREMS